MFCVPYPVTNCSGRIGIGVNRDENELVSSHTLFSGTKLRKVLRNRT